MPTRMETIIGVLQLTQIELNRLIAAREKGGN